MHFLYFFYDSNQQLLISDGIIR